VVAIGLAAVALSLAACGAEDHANELRPPSPIQVAALINDEQVLLSEDEVGAGLANVTVSNQSADEVELIFEGPSEAAGTAPEDLPPGRQSVAIVVAAGSTGALKVNLEEGTYKVSAAPAPAPAPAPAGLTVGPERPSAQNDLLLP
jgi:hypothetical protein